MFFEHHRALQRRLLAETFPLLTVAAHRLLRARPTPGLTVQRVIEYGVLRAAGLADIVSRTQVNLFRRAPRAQLRAMVLKGAIKAMALFVSIEHLRGRRR